MLTTSIKGRALDYSRVVGGRAFRGIVYVECGDGDDIYVVTRDSYASGIAKITIGSEIDDEEEVLTFGDISESVFNDSWPACAVFNGGKLYVSDELKNCVRVFDSKGHLLTEFGKPGNKQGEFDRPSGIASDSSNNIFVSDTLNHRVQKFSSDGTFITEFGSYGTGPGQLHSPWGMSLDNSGNLLLADHLNNRIQKFSPDGKYINTFGNEGTDAETLDHPSDITVDPDGDIYVSDWANDRVQVFDKDGNHVTAIYGAAFELSKWQQQYVRGNPDVYKARRRVASLEPEKWFALPTGVAYDAKKSRLLVVDSQRWRIQIFDKLTNYSDPQFNI